MAGAPVKLLRDGLLAGQVVAVAGPAEGLEDDLRVLGADVAALTREPADEGSAEREVAGTLERHGRIDTLVIDARGLVEVPLVLDAAWLVVHAVATAAMIPEERGGKMVLVAPAPPAEAARSGLENLARTLSIEWARFGVRPTAIAPGGSSTEEQVGALVAYLASPAGDYFSGSRLSLGEVVLG